MILLVPSLRLAMLVLAIACVAWPAHGQSDAIKPDGQKPEPPKPTALQITPRGADSPLFRYRLFPVESQRQPGNSVPVYLRLMGETRDEATRQVNEKSAAWQELPPSSLPIAEARGFVNQFSSKLKQMDFAARRLSTSWDYTIAEEREDAVNILLPDVQELRTWSRLLTLQSKVEIAEKNYEKAVRSIETGLSMSRQVGEGPFLINGLVGIAIANQTLARVEEFIVQPDAPNLYWALTAVPRPLVPLRHSMETEQALGTYLLPELVDLESPRTEAEWVALLTRLHSRWNRVANMLWGDSKEGKIATVSPDLAAFTSQTLPVAKTYVKEHRGSIDGMSDAQIMLLYVGGVYREERDRVFAPSYLPYGEAAPLYDAAEASRKKAGDPVTSLIRQIAPTIRGAHQGEAKLDRRVAALRVVEAIRMQAAADRGKLPETLEAIKVVPVPSDPLTGKPFVLHGDGDGNGLTLSSPDAPNTPGTLSYRITKRP